MKALFSKVISIMVIAMMIVVSVPSTVMAGKRVCGKGGCTNPTGNNGTVFCDRHAAEYAREEGYKVCGVTGCYAPACKGSSYCSRHTCRDSKCNNRAGESGYCTTHAPKKSSSSSSYSYKKNNSTKKHKSSSSTSKKKYDPYDVYDYKSAQDFADDKYEEFYDYEDDYEDEDEAYDAAEDYWREHH